MVCSARIVGEAFEKNWIHIHVSCSKQTIESNWTSRRIENDRLFKNKDEKNPISLLHLFTCFKIVFDENVYLVMCKIVEWFGLHANARRDLCVHVKCVC